MERLKELRKRAKMSQVELADVMGVTQSTLGKWELGKQQPDIECIKKIANFFDVSIDYLLGMETDPILEKINKLDDEQKNIAKKALSEALPDIFSEIPDDDDGYVEGVGFTDIDKAKSYIEKYEAEVMDKSIKISDKEIFAMANAIHTINKIKNSKV